jgi:hypothetical protein
VQIGPPNSRFPPSKDKSKWDPKDVADWILAEKSSLVISCVHVKGTIAIVALHDPYLFL